MTKRTYWFPILAAALVFFCMTPTTTNTQLFAQTYTASPEAQGTSSVGDLQTIDSNGNKVSCSTITDAKGGVLMGYIVPCVTYTIGISAQKFSVAMINLLSPIFYAFLTFVVTMFGVKVLQGGQRDVHKEAFLLVLKIGIVISMFQLIPTVIIPSIYGVMSESQAVVAGALKVDDSSLHCDVAKFGDDNTPQVWKQMDCVMGKLYGFTTGSGQNANGGQNKNMFLASSIIGLLGGFFFGGTFGLALFFGLIGVLISMFLIIMRTGLAFINSYLIICVMLLIAPLFLPLVLMRITSDYFEKWWKNILAALLLPILVTGYALFSMLLYDKMLFAPDAMINKLFDYAAVKEGQELPRALCGEQFANDPTATRSKNTAVPFNSQNLLAPLLQNMIMPTLTGSINKCGGATVSPFNVEKLPGFTNAADFAKTMFTDCIKLVVLGYLITAGMNTVSQSMSALVSSSGAVSLLGASTRQEEKFNESIRQGKQAAFSEMRGSGKSANGVTGSEFVRQIPYAAKAGAKAFAGIKQDKE